MRVSTVAVLASTLFGFASAQKFQQVEVGTPDSKLLFNPPTVDGFGPGDVIQFIFYPKAHSVTQSTFADPCTYNGTGINTGLQKYNDTKPAMLKSWNFTLPANSSTEKPLWFFCANTGHCQQGMVFSINPGKGKTADGTPTSHEAYVKKAMAVPIPGASGPSNSTSTTGGAGGANNTAAGNTAAGNGASNTAGTSAGAASASGSAPSASTTSSAGSVARNSAGALAAVGIALGLLL